MQSTTINIPKKCKVGFNTREDTYTKKLGYIIYHDGKVWRKENSWEGWREKYQDKKTFDANKLAQFNSQVKRYTEYWENIQKEPAPKSGYDHSKPYRSMTLEEYLKQCNVSSIDTYNYYPGKVSKDKSITPIEFDNVPMDGFVLNKKAGGYSSGWNHRQTYCRVYDPRGFEFEITIPNLLYILENSNSIKGKGLEGKFIYGWEGKDLILIPEEAPEYKDMMEHTKLLSVKLKKKDLVIGGVYYCSDGIERTYMGEHEYYDNYDSVYSEKKVLWWSYIYTSPYNKNTSICFETRGIDSIKKYVSMNENYADLASQLEKQESYQKVEIEYKLVTESDLETLRSTSYSYRRSIPTWENIYIKEKNKFKRIKILLESTYTYRDNKGSGYTIYTTKEGINYKTIKELLKNHELWQQQKMTK